MAANSVQVAPTIDHPTQPSVLEQSVQHWPLPPVSPRLPSEALKLTPFGRRVLPSASGVPVKATRFSNAHSAWRKCRRKFHALVVCGRRPVVKLILEGEHTVCWQKARSNTSPPSASPCRCGVCIAGEPAVYIERSGRRSSKTIYSTFLRRPARALAQVHRIPADASSSGSTTSSASSLGRRGAAISLYCGCQTGRWCVCANQPAVHSFLDGGGARERALTRYVQFRHARRGADQRLTNEWWQ